jgi:nucleoside-diphosphate-sugar epimerase
LIKAFIQKKYKIHALSRSNFKNTKSVSWFFGDITKKVPQEFFIKSSLLIHCAGTANRDCFNLNVRGTSLLLKKAIRSNIKKIIYISSCAVYDFTEQAPLIHVNSKKNMHNKYAASKMLAEKIVRRKAKLAKIPFVILRPASIVSKSRQNIYIKIQKIAAKKKLFLPLPLPCNFFITNIDQLVKIILHHESLKNNSTLNICKTVSWLNRSVKKNQNNPLIKTVIFGLTFLRNIFLKCRIFCKYPLFAGSFSPSTIESYRDRN